jgi:predicted esterase
VIGVEFGRAAKDLLEGAGADVVYRESPIPHTIDPQFAREQPAWIARRLAPL